jgi:hypothetical protein
LRQARRDPVSRQHGFDRLAAARLKDAELGDPPQLFGCGRPGFACGREEEVEARLTGARDGRRLRWSARRSVPFHLGDDRASHVAREPRPPAREIREERVRE